MLRLFAILYTIVFLFIGISGFFPEFLAGKNMGITFANNLWLNLFNIVVGAWGIFSIFMSWRYIRVYFQVIGVLIGILAILGFFYGDELIFDVFASSRTNTWFHVITAVLALILGFGSNSRD